MLGFSFCRNRIARLFKLESWGIGIIQRQTGDLSTLVNNGRLRDAQWLPRLASGRYRADPFIWFADDGLRLIFEEYLFWSGQARICSVPLEAIIQNSTARLEIAVDTHLSYPFIVDLDGVSYCIPENAESGRVSIYSWKPDEKRWRLAANLIDELVLDPTLYCHEGVWYLFGTLLQEGPEGKLCVWHSRSLFGPWNRHNHDAITTDGQGRRSAGPLFRHGNVLYRPAQCATGGYGSAVIIYRIELLSLEAYREIAVSRLAPDPSGPYPNGLHTLTVTSHAIVIDGKIMELNWVAPLLKAVWLASHHWRRWREARSFQRS